MRKILIISLLIFWSAATAILTAGLVFYQNNQNNKNNIQSPSISDSAGSAGQSSAGSASGVAADVVLSAAEIAKHNSANDCWMIISGQVYNLTSYIPGHPGGAGAIVSYCGKDGTVGFQTKDIGQPHSQAASNLLARYLIGSLNQRIIKGSPGSQNINPAGNQAVSGSPVATPRPTGNPTATPVPAPISSNISLTLAEIAKHNSANDCWMIISGQVYNLTSYIPGHPGGSVMVPYCGRDATAVFLSGPPHAHSQSAINLLSRYLLGPLNTTVLATPTPSGAVLPTSSPAPRGEEDD